jgi:hypothetical protein
MTGYLVGINREGGSSNNIPDVDSGALIRDKLQSTYSVLLLLNIRLQSQDGELPIRYASHLSGLYSGISGGICGFSRDSQRGLHVTGLLESIVSKRDGGEDESGGCSKQSSSEKRQISSKGNQSPVKFRLLLTLLSFFVSFVIGFLGWYYVDNNRLGAGFALIGLSSLVVSAALLLLWLGQFPSTWEWLL